MDGAPSENSGGYKVGSCRAARKDGSNAGKRQSGPIELSRSRARRLLAIRAFLTGQALLSTFQTPKRHRKQHRRGGVQFVDAEAGNRRALPHVPFREGASIESERFARCDTSVNF